MRLTARYVMHIKQHRVQPERCQTEVYICFDEPQRAITGHAVVLYDGDLVAGGGIIEKIAPELDDVKLKDCQIWIELYE